LQKSIVLYLGSAEKPRTLQFNKEQRSYELIRQYIISVFSFQVNRNSSLINFVIKTQIYFFNLHNWHTANQLPPSLAIAVGKLSWISWRQIRECVLGFSQSTISVGIVYYSIG